MTQTKHEMVTEQLKSLRPSITDMSAGEIGEMVARIRAARVKPARRKKPAKKAKKK